MRVALRTALIAGVVSMTIGANTVPAATGGSPEPAEALLKAAETRAETGGKNVLVVFHASWCVWCKRMEKYLYDPAVRPLIEANYEVVWLDALERPGTMRLENPGARKLMATWGGRGGLPFYVVLSPGGDKLGDSGQIGFPSAPNEIDAFVGLLRSTGPRLGPDDLDALRTRLTAR